jgi:hypothetical protein
VTFDAEHADALAASIHATYRTELAKAKMQLILYRDALIEHGVDPPDRDGEELLRLYRDCQLVISTATEVIGRVGSAKELL